MQNVDFTRHYNEGTPSKLSLHWRLFRGMNNHVSPKTYPLSSAHFSHAFANKVSIHIPQMTLTIFIARMPPPYPNRIIVIILGMQHAIPWIVSKISKQCWNQSGRHEYQHFAVQWTTVNPLRRTNRTRLRATATSRWCGRQDSSDKCNQILPINVSIRDNIWLEAGREYGALCRRTST